MKFAIRVALFFALFGTSFSLQANTDLIPEKLVLQSTSQFGIVYTHQLKQSQTIYGLSKFFNTNMDLIAAANPGVDLSKVKKMQYINIPINTNMLISERKLSPQKNYIPVYYTVKAKDNLFRISKVYFNQKIENVMNINNLKNMELSVGQKLLVGWYEYNPIYKNKLAWTKEGIDVDFAVNAVEAKPNYIPIEQRREIAAKKRDTSPMRFEKIVSKRETFVDPPIEETVYEKPVTQETVPTKVEPVQKETEVITEIKEENKTTTEVAEKPEITEVSEEEIVEEEGTDANELSDDPFEARNNIFKGDYETKPTIKSKKIRAQWNSRSKDKTNLFALHSTAKKGSFIEIYNPMLDRMVIAKVVGNIPDRVHKNNVELIVSPKVAETLGVVDKKFFVKIRYIEQN